MGTIEEKFEWDGRLPKPPNMKFTHEDANALSNSKGGGPTLTVAASDALHPERADYQCNGTNDDIPINSAFTSLHGAPGKIILTDGEFDITAGIIVKENQSFHGTGIGITTLKTSNNAQIYAYYSGAHTDIKISDFTLKGNGYIRVQNANRVHLSNILAYDLDNTFTSAFFIYANSDAIIDYITLTNCYAIDCDRYGFFLSGSGTTDTIRNVSFQNCQAINCGKYGQYGGVPGWDVGFDLGEGISYIENIRLNQCYATGSWESGFHIEHGPIKKDIIFTNCVSTNNGQDKVSPTYAAGFLLGSGCSCYGCIANDNKRFGFKFLGNDKDEAIKFDVSTKNNEFCGVYLENVKRAQGNLLSKGDKHGLYLAHANEHLNIEATIIDATDLAIYRYTSSPTYITDSKLNLNIYTPTGTSNIAATLKYLKDSEININYVNTNTLTKGLLFYYLDGCDISVKAKVASDYALTFENTIINTLLHNTNLRGGGIYLDTDTSVETFIKDIIIRDTTNGINGNNVAINGFILDHDSIIFENVTNEIVGTEAANLRYKSYSGGITLTNGTTSVVQGHRMFSTPISGNIVITPLSSLGNASFFWVDTVTSTQFTINLNTDPGQDVTFGWQVRVTI